MHSFAGNLKELKKKLSSRDKKTIVSVVGPTASGKTSLAIEFAKELNSEVLSFDSRQFYKEMNIGTAVPSKQELSEVPHHFIQHISIHKNYSAGDFEHEAIQFITNFFKQNNTLIIVGGSGLYEKAITEGFETFPNIKEDVKNYVQNIFLEKGTEGLSKELKKNDPKTFSVIDLDNHRRVIRALEVSLSGDYPYSHYLNKKDNKRNFDVIKFGVLWEREKLYERINKRVDFMMEQGLLEEVKGLHRFKHLKALQTVGYRELFSYLEGENSLDFAVEEIKKNTRRYAKRQLTWYRKQKVDWL